MTTPRSDETAADVNSSQRDARSGSLQRMVRPRPCDSTHFAIVSGLYCGACGWALRRVRSRSGLKLVCDNRECLMTGRLYDEPKIMLVPFVGMANRSESETTQTADSRNPNLE